MRRTLLLAILVLLAVAAGWLWWQTRPAPVLTVTTWAGEYGRAQAAALMRPYAAAKGVDVRIAQWNGDLAPLARAITHKTYRGDVIDFELPEAVAACRHGLLEKIDAARLPPGADGMPAARDFVPGAVGPCWVGSAVYSQLVAYAPGRFAVQKPTTLRAFFDTARFPGPRALNAGSAKFNLEMALLADGAAPADVYKTLDTDAGVARALRKLASLGPDLVWWHRPDEPAPLLKSGAVAFSTLLNGNLYDAKLAGAIWDHQLYELDVFGVPRGDPRKALAMDFIRFATATAPLAALASWLPYGPARRSSRARIGGNPALHISMKTWQPTSHFGTAFAVDDGWWWKNRARIAPRWQAFVAARTH